MRTYVCSNESAFKANGLKNITTFGYMKKIIATLALGIICQSTFAINIDTLFAQFKNKEGADYINIPTLVLKFMRTFTKNNNDKSYHFL